MEVNGFAAAPVRAAGRIRAAPRGGRAEGVIAALLVWLPCAGGLVAQTPPALRGTVVDAQSGEPLAMAAVAAGGRIAYTDASGRFTLAGASDSMVVSVTRIGYTELRTTVGAVAGELRLARAPVLLDALTVAAGAGGIARGTALSLQRVERARVAERAGTGLAEALEGIEGVAAARMGSWGARAAVRGLAGERVAVLVDGNRVNRACTFGMDQGLATLDPATVERVEVLSGPGSALYGSGNIGGVINVVTAHPAVHPGLSGEVRLGASAGVPGVSAGASVRGGSGRFSLATSLDGGRYGDYRSPGRTVPGSGFRHGTATVELGVETRPGERLSLSTQWYEGRDIGWPAMGDASIPEEGRRSAALDYGRQLGGVLDALAARAFIQRLDHHMVLRMPMMGPSGTSVTTTDALSHSTATGARLQTRLLPWHRLGLDAGLEVAQWAAEATRWTERTLPDGSTSARTVFRSWPAVRVLDAGAFAQAELRLAGPLGASAGARLDRVVRRADEHPTSDESVRTGNAGLSLTLPAGFGARATLGRGYRVPDPTELFGLAPRPDGFVYRGNPSLRTETGRNLELSVSRAGTRLNASLTAFRNDLDGLIAPVLVPGDSVAGRPVRSYANLGDARIEGLTASGRWQATSRLSFSGTLSRLRGHERPSGAPLAGIAPLVGTARARLGVASTTWLELEGTGAARQGRYARAAGEVATPGWSSFALRTGARVARTDVVLGVENALNRTYRAHLDPVSLLRPGRNVYLKATRAF